MKNIISKLLLWVCIGLVLCSVTACDATNGSKPMLKIITSTSVGVTIFSKTDYFIVYENGAVKKTSEFAPAKVISYNFVPNSEGETLEVLLQKIDIDTPEGKELNNIANNIVLLMDGTKIKVISINELFFLGDRYFFDVLCDNGKAPISNKLFEYFPTDNSIKEIVSFNSKGIKHVEFYKPA